VARARPPLARSPPDTFAARGLDIGQEAGLDTNGEAAGERDAAQLFVRPGLQQKHVRRLRRGQIPIEAEADLHGMRRREAEKALASFLRECRDEGLRCVRVIHGKGRGSRGGQAVLKWQVDGWLRHDDGVMAFSSAQPRDGGTGAVYVLLKR
jgi:DNA-nicking Smr family endonuclease